MRRLSVLLRRWIHPAPFELCPVCGGDAGDHEIRTLARERFSPGTSGVEAHLARREFAGAAALHDPGTMGDQLVHELVRCGDKVVLVTSAEPAGLGLGSHIRRSCVLEDAEAETAWICAEAQS